MQSFQTVGLVAVPFEPQIAAVAVLAVGNWQTAVAAGSEEVLVPAAGSEAASQTDH